MSEDEGKTWKYTRVLEEEDGQQEFSYPSIVQESYYDKIKQGTKAETETDEESCTEAAEDLLIHISYTWKRQAIKHTIVSENWIMEDKKQIHLF